MYEREISITTIEEFPKVYSSKRYPELYGMLKTLPKLKEGPLDLSNEAMVHRQANNCVDLLIEFESVCSELNSYINVLNVKLEWNYYFEVFSYSNTLLTKGKINSKLNVDRSVLMSGLYKVKNRTYSVQLCRKDM